MNIINLGKQIRNLRKKTKKSLKDLASLSGVHPTYLSKIENGQKRPSQKLLLKLLDLYKVSPSEFLAIQLLAGYGKTYYGELKEQKEVNYMTSKQEEKPEGQIQNNQMQIQVPNNLPVLYTDSAFVTASAFGLVLDFAQTLGPTNNQNVVARIGMSSDHAKALLKVLSQKLTEVELLKEKKDKSD